LTVADIEQDQVRRAVDEFGSNVASPDDILFQDVDVVAPCALGAILDEKSIPRLRARIVAGGANNQLATADDGRRLFNAGILYAPDYVINGGGIINVACEYYGDVDDEGVVGLVEKIGPRLANIFDEAKSQRVPTNEVADAQAKKIIATAGS
jgi:leucine dehydrogenase